MLASAPILDRIIGATDLEFEVDWESPAGGEEPSFVRVSLPPYIFSGPGEAHWIGQPCAVLDLEVADGDVHAVVLACGCRAQVPLSTLTIVPAKGPDV